MIRELDRAPAGELPEYDLCIVGSGPAGTTIACELAGSGLRIAVLESGLTRPTPHGDALRKVESAGIRIKDWSRERVLGGASTTWAGLSSPLDAADMGQRPFLRAGAWPIERGELVGLWTEAAERYRFPPLELFGAGGIAALKAKGALRPQWQRLEEKVFLACSEPQDFGREWRHVLDGPQVDCWLDATVVELEGERATRRVRAARVRTRGGERRVRARAFVLATGGIENARLLLLSRSICPAGLGNEHDQVGRYLMNHPKSYFGIVRLARPVEGLPYYFGCLHAGYAGYAGLRLAESVQAAEGLLNSYVRFEPLFPWTDSEGVEALVLFVKRSQALFRRWKERKRDEVVELRDWSETGDDSDLQNQRRSALGMLGLAGLVLRDAPRVARYLYYRLTRAKPRITRARLRNFMEMEPDPENRVTLAESLDGHGMPLPRVAHRCGERDRRSLIALHEALREELPRAGFGELEGELARAEPWPIDQDASHHMGTTRMGTDPRSSVVDPELRVHSVENLWIAGASVFPTSGCANPTFTLVALSIRLARSLRRELAVSSAGPRHG